MTKRYLLALASAGAVAAVLVGVLLTGGGSEGSPAPAVAAGQAAAPAPSSAPAAAAAPARTEGQAAAGTSASAPRSSGEGLSEGFGIHGHWAIEIRDADGTFVSRYEFDNALTYQGQNDVGRSLLGQKTTGRWAIHLIDVTALTSPCPQIGVLKQCIITEPQASSSPTGPSVFKNLTKAAFFSPDEFVGDNGFTLNGSAIAANDAEINTVATSIDFCFSNTVAPADCTAGPLLLSADLGGSFTLKTIDPIAVQAGQQILVTVEIVVAP